MTLKWLEKKLSGWRFRLFLFLGSMVLIFLATVAPYAKSWINRPVSSVKIVGKLNHLSRATIERQISPVVASRFFTMDSGHLKRVLLSIPWVGHVGIRKHWPDTLWIKILERFPVARWNNQALIDSEGKFFSPGNINDFDSLPLLKGKESQKEGTWNSFSLLGKMMNNEKIFDHVSSFSLAGDDDWLFDLNGASIRTGAGDHPQKIKLLNFLYLTRFKSTWTNISRIDFRYKNGIAIRWKGKKPGNKTTAYSN